MKKLAMVVILLAGTFMSGCSTLTETPPERDRRIVLQTDLQLKMLVEDWDTFWLQDHVTSLTTWHPYVGY